MLRHAALLLLLAVGPACSSTEVGACIPGAQVACACPGGGQGAQVCASDGKSFGQCMGCDIKQASTTPQAVPTPEPANTQAPAPLPPGAEPPRDPPPPPPEAPPQVAEAPPAEAPVKPRAASAPEKPIKPSGSKAVTCTRKCTTGTFGKTCGPWICPPGVKPPTTPADDPYG